MLSDGNPITIDSCRRCGIEPAKGMSVMRDGVQIFSCDACGRRMHLGFAEEVFEKQKKGIEDKEKAEENRDRYQREMNEYQRKEFIRRQEQLDPDALSSFNLTPWVDPRIP